MDELYEMKKDEEKDKKLNEEIRNLKKARKLEKKKQQEEAPTKLETICEDILIENKSRWKKRR